MKRRQCGRFASQNLAAAYLRAGRYDEAKAIVEKAKARGLYQPIGDIVLLQIAFIRGDHAAMDKLLRDYAGNGFETTMISIAAVSEAALGELKSSAALNARAVQLAQQNNQKELAAQTSIWEASAEAEMGFDAGQAKRGIERAASASDDVDTQTGAAVAWAQLGDVGRSQQLVEKLAKQYPKNLILNQGWIPIVRALQAMHKNQADEAVRLLQPTSPYEPGSFPGGLGLSAMYFRAKGYLMARDGAKATAEFQKALDHRGVDPVSPFYALSQLGLARALAMQGDNAKAKTAYQDFFSMWKDADPDVPVLKQAKAEYAKLQ